MKYFTKRGKNGLQFYCPGCKVYHDFNDTWNIKWTGNKPTVSPSILVNNSQWGVDNFGGSLRCPLYIKNGQIQYLNDCTHKLKGETVDMEEAK